jgi:hypothetical protein
MENVENDENEEAQDRIERLEKEIIQLRWRANLGLGLGLFFLLCLLSMVATPSSRRASFDQVTVRKLVAEQLHVKAENHKAYGTFRISSNVKPQLSLLDEDGSCRVQLQLDAHDSPVLGTYDKQVSAGFELTNKPDGSPVLTLYDKRKTNRLVINAGSETESSGVHIFDTSGQMRASLSTRPVAGNNQSATGLYLLRSGGGRALDVVITRDDVPTVGMADENGKRRVGMFLTPRGDGDVRVIGPDGAHSLTMTARANGEIGLYTFDGTNAVKVAPQAK